MSVVFPINPDPRFRISTATDGQTEFTVPFPFQVNADITAVLIELDGTETPLAEGDDYTLTGAGSPSGGTLTLIVPAEVGQQVVRYGAAILTRTSSITQGGKYSTKQTDDELDRRVIVEQEQARDLGRALKVGFGQVGGAVAPGAAGNLALWGADGGLVEGGSAADIANAEENAAIAVAAAADAEAAQAASEAAALVVAGSLALKADVTWVEAAFDALRGGVSSAFDTLSEIATSLAGKLVAASNLSDLVSVPTARLNMGVPTIVSTLAALKALDTTKDTRALYDGSTWEWKTGDYSTFITADTRGALYAKANAIASSAGAWVRSYGPEMRATWFGVVADYSTATDTGTDNSAAITAAIDMAQFLGVPLRFPAGNIRVASKIDRSYSTATMLVLRGVNQRKTIFYVRGVENSSGFLKITITNISVDVRIEISDMLIGNRGDASTHMNCGTAIELVRNPVPSLRFYTEIHIYDVDTYTYNNADGYFDKGIVLTGWRYPIVERCRLEGTPAGPTVSGAVDRHQDTWAGYLATVGFDFENCYGGQAILCHCRSVKTGYIFNSVDGEGGDLLMSTAVDVKIGLFKRASTISRASRSTETTSTTATTA
jgi:hypothetical protein